MDLLERSLELAALDGALDEVRTADRGSLVLLAGEAGIGKTALLDAFCAANDRVPTARGACEPLFTPRPLGPILEIAEQLGGDAAHLRDHEITPHAIVQLLVHELRRRPRTIVLLEDLHWADEATLDVVRILARRLDSAPVVLVASYRDDSLGALHPLTTLLGELPPGRTIRLKLTPLSVDAVAMLAGGVDAEALHAQTGGNPFFVTEVLASARDELPATIREAVLARVARLDPAARAVLSAVAVVPPRAELDLLEALVDDYPHGVDGCLVSGMLVSAGNAVVFRHELARVAVEESLSPPQRLELHRRALAALATKSRPDLARLVHHAEGADDDDALLRYAAAAGELAASLGAHREAAAHFGRALRLADELEEQQRIELLEGRSYECYLTDQIDAALDARTRALEEHRRRGDRLREGDSHRWLSRLEWFAGDNAAARREALRAIELLEPLPPGPELAMAYSNMSQLSMLEDDRAETVAWGGRAIELAERLDSGEILVHALTNVGTAELRSGEAEGRAKLERSLALALEAGLQEHAARAYTNLASAGVVNHDGELGRNALAAGIDFCREHDLDSWHDYLLGWLARVQLECGDWDAAAETAESVVLNPRVAAPSRITPLAVLGRLRARRGEGPVWPVLDEALELATATGELQRLAPVAVARAEALWLEGQVGRVDTETNETLDLALRHDDRWSAGELCAWRRRAGVAEAVSSERLAEPFALELAGEADQAAALWDSLGYPYEAALARASAETEPSLRRSLADLQQLGAKGAALRVARLLRERGVRHVRVGPRASTRSNPAGLTARELDVLGLVSEGLRNRDIAKRLSLSEKTVDHHVSAILRKLGVGTRGQAAAEAARLGIER
jgi:DNA-binding CsgD family transcriptional regulator/tetratricopeptide (TPR) repeat protein